MGNLPFLWLFFRQNKQVGFLLGNASIRQEGVHFPSQLSVLMRFPVFPYIAGGRKPTTNAEPFRKGQAHFSAP